MINFAIAVLFFLCCVFRVTSAPVIKASGVQWSEPKGSGKGNITLIMIPQNTSGCNETDMIVAVKSDYQILSQDTQLLNLVVNENIPDKTNVSKDCKDLTKPVNIDKQINQIDAEKNNKYPNTVKFFEPDKKLENMKSNSTITSKNSLSEDTNNIKQSGIPASTDYSLKNIFDLLNMTDPNGEKIHVNDKAVNANMSVPTDSTAKLYNILNISEPNSEIVTESNNKVIDDKSVNFTSSLINSNDNFVNEALNILEKLKQNPSVYEREKSNHNLKNVNEDSRGQGETKYLTGGDLALASDENEYLYKESDQASKNKIDKSNLEGGLEEITLFTCLTTTTKNYNPSILTTSNQVVNEKTVSSGAGNNIDPITTESPNPSIATVIASEMSDTTSSLRASATSLGGREQILTSNPVATEMCTTIIVRCNPSNTNAVFDQISQMVAENKKNEITTPMLSITRNIGAGSGTLAKSQTECVTTSPGPQAGKQALHKKITLEPPVNCETFLKAREQRTTLAVSNDHNSQLKEDLAIPLVESAVFLANNNEMPKGKHIPIVLNTSLDDFSLTDLQEKEHHGKVAELYNNNPLFLNVGNGVLSDDSSIPFPVQNNGKKKILLKPSKVYRDKILCPDINEILKMRFAGRNVILEQKPSYRSEMLNTHCESTPESKNGDSNSEMEPDDEETQESQPSLQETTTRKMVSSSELPVGDDYSQSQSTSSPKEKSTKQSDLTQPTDDEDSFKTTLTSKKITTQSTDLLQESDGSGNVKSHLTSARKISTTTPADLSTTLEEENMGSIPDLHVKTTTKKTLHTTKFDFNENTKSSFNLPVKTTTKKSEFSVVADEKSENSDTTILDDTTEKSDFTLSTEYDEDIKAQFSLPVKTTTHKSLLPKKKDEKVDSQSLDSQESGKSNTQKSDYTKSSKGECNKTPIKKVCVTKPLPTKCPRTIPTHKSPQDQNESCNNNNVYIPANSVKEIIIQIVKNTAKPGKPDSPSSGTCYKSDNEMQNIIFSEGQDSRSGFVKQMPPPKTAFNEQEILDKPDDSSFNTASNNQQVSKSSRNNNHVVDLEHYSAGNEFNIVGNECVLDHQNKNNYNKQTNLQHKNVAEHNAKSLAANILKLLIDNKSVIKPM